MAAYATVEQYATTAGLTLNSTQQAQAGELLDQATARIKARLPEGYEPDPDVAKSVCIAVVRRAVRPAGLRSKTVGDVAYSYDTDAAGSIYLTDEELADLLAGWDEGSSGAYTVPLRDEAYPPTIPGVPPTVVQ